MSAMTEAEKLQQLEQVRDNINYLVSQISTAQHELGGIYNYVVSSHLAEGVGYKNAWDYLGRHVRGISRTSLAMYSLVAAYIARDFVAKYGTERIRSWLNYVRANHDSIPWWDPGATILRVPYEGGYALMKSLSDCNVDDVRRTTRAVRSRTRARVPVTDAVRSLFLGDSISRHFKDVAPVRLNTRTQDGRTLVTVYDVPVDELERLIQALRAGMEAQPVALRSQKRAA